MGTFKTIVVWAVAVLGFGSAAAHIYTWLTRDASRAASSVTAKAGLAHTIGGLCDKQGTCVRKKLHEISRREWGETWPFTVDTATLVCAPDIGPAGQLFAVGGGAWAANGTTQTFARVHGLTLEIDGAIQPVRPFDPEDDPRVDRLWAEMSRPAGLEPGRQWARVSVGPIISALAEMGCN